MSICSELMCGQCCITRRGRAAETHRVWQPHVLYLYLSLSCGERDEPALKSRTGVEQLDRIGRKLTVHVDRTYRYMQFLDPRRPSASSRRSRIRVCPIQDRALLEIKASRLLCRILTSRIRAMLFGQDIAHRSHCRKLLMHASISALSYDVRVK